MIPLQIDLMHKKIVLEILKKYNITAYAFGSRAKNKAKEYSDLDLCIKNMTDKSTLRKIQDEFEESDLPFKVDIIIWDDITDSFKNNITKDLVLVE